MRCTDIFILEQLGKTKREMLKVYEENLELKEVLLRSKEAVFMR